VAAASFSNCCCPTNIFCRRLSATPICSWGVQPGEVLVESILRCAVAIDTTTNIPELLKTLGGPFQATLRGGLLSFETPDLLAGGAGLGEAVFGNEKVLIHLARINGIRKLAVPAAAVEKAAFREYNEHVCFSL
jgi:hypothetical protein